MDISATTKIHFQFPDALFQNKESFIDALMSGITSNRKSGYAGYANTKYLRDYLKGRFHDEDTPKYHNLSIEKREGIQETITSTLERCYPELSAVLASLSIFIFPWFPTKNDEGFGGVNGFCPYKDTFHLFISPAAFSSKSLAQTVSHELNHAIFFRLHYSKQTLLDSLITEGLAENFREEILGGGAAPWSVALTKKEAEETFILLTPLLKKNNLYKEIFWNEEKYKQWTGYSIGYWLIKSFRQNNPLLSWRKIMKMEPTNIFKKSRFVSNEV